MITKMLGMFTSVPLCFPVEEGAIGGGVDKGSTGPASGKEAPNSPAIDDIYSSNSPETGEEEDSETEESTETEESQDGGEGEGEDFTSDETSEDTEEPTEEGESEESEPSKSPSVVKLDAETIAAIRGPAQETQHEEEPTYTREQIKQMLNPVEVTPEVVAAIRDEDPVKATAALQNLMNSVVKNAFSLAKVYVSRKEKEFQQTLAPLTQQFEQANTQQIRSNFYSQNKNLVKYDKIVKAAAREISPTKSDGSEKTRDEIFKEVAASTIATLKSLGLSVPVQGKPNANPGAGVGGREVPKPNKLSTPGRSGGDNKNGKVTQNNPDADIYAR